jgi:hypothetical protein
LQVEFTGSNGSTSFTDDGDSGHTLTAVGNAQIQSNKLECDGSGDRVIIARHPDFQFDLSKGFTIEVWGFQPDAAGPIIAAYEASVSLNERSWFLTNSPNGTMRVGLFEDGTNQSDVISNSWTPGVVDIAVVYDPLVGASNNVYLYRGGAKVATGTFAGSEIFRGPVDLAIGGLYNNAAWQSLDGRMSAVRITHAALYTAASYSVPSLPL